jgi:DNA helicase IV
MRSQTGANDVNSLVTSAFVLPERLAAKADPALIGDDEQHFAAIAQSLGESIADLSGRLDAERKAPGGLGQKALDRDTEVHRLTARLRALRRFGLDLCLGRMVGAESVSGRPEPVYIGRLGLRDSAGRQLLVDWRSPAAEPFFGATHANPMGLESRRRYRWTRGRITDYWDEVFTRDGLAGHAAALDDQSAFIASLSGSRSSRMRDVLGTIAADQDAIIRAGSRGALVVDGGPGTGKTVVALHRAAYLLYSDPRLGHHRGGVLFIGPHQPYLAYVSDVLPRLGEEGVQICTLRDLVPEGAAAATETDPDVARLKSSADLVKAIEAAVRFYERLPATGMTVETPWSGLWLSAADWAEAFEAAEPGTPHNEAHGQIRAELLTILVDKRDDDVPADLLRRSLLENRELRLALHRAWPLIEPTDLVADLWTVPAYLRRCAPWLSPDEVTLLQRPDAQAWTVSDLPILDAARQRLGDPQASGRQRRHEAAVAAERERMARVVDSLIEVADDEYGTGLVTMLRGQDFQDALVDQAALPSVDPDRLAGPFAHVIVDEAQELTDAEWQMLLLRCPSRSFTIVGDRAQARHGFTESWRERLERVGFDQVGLATLSINYRTPEEVMAEAEPVIRAVLPDANVPTSIRGTGVPVVHRPASDLHPILDTWLASHSEGVACVIGDPPMFGEDTARATSRVRSLTPELVKGLEFDLVILVDPEAFGTGIEGAVDRYVAMTRATQQLVILTSSGARALARDMRDLLGARIRAPDMVSTNNQPARSHRHRRQDHPQPVHLRPGPVRRGQEGCQSGCRLGQADGVSGADAAGPEHLGIDPGAGLRVERVKRLDPVVTGENPQRVGVAGQGAVGEGRHGAPGSAGDHAQHEVAAHPQDPVEPVVLGESRGRGADDDVGPVAFQVGAAARAELGDPVQRRGGQQMQRREVDERAGRAAAADLHEFGRDLRVDAVAEHGLGYGAIQRGSGHWGRGQRDGLVQQVGQHGVDTGVVAPDDLSLRQRDPDRAVLRRSGGKGEQVTPQAGELRAGDLARGPADHGQPPVPGQPGEGHVPDVQILAEHRLDRVPAQRDHGSQHRTIIPSAAGPATLRGTRS